MILSVVRSKLFFLMFAICSVVSASNYQWPYELVDAPCFAPPDMTIALHKDGIFFINGDQIPVEEVDRVFRKKAATAEKICFHYETQNDREKLLILMEAIASVRLPVSPYKDRGFKTLMVPSKKKL